jgi:hypothetical protein
LAGSSASLSSLILCWMGMASTESQANAVTSTLQTTSAD